MSTLKSSAEDLTLNADGSGNDIIIQSNASTKAIVTAEGTVGIGTDSPSRLLTLYGDTGIALQNSTTGTGTGNGTHIWVNSAGSGELLIQNRENSDIEFLTNDTVRMRILAAGGLCFGTDTAAANALDDYEEGTWTPALRGGTTTGSPTYHSQVGHYTKVGRLVTIMGNLHNSNLVDLDGVVYITGLPFTTHGYDSTISFGYAGSMGITAGESITGNTVASSTEVKLGIWNSTGGTGYLDDAELTNGAQIVFSGTYHAP